MAKEPRLNNVSPTSCRLGLVSPDAVLTVPLSVPLNSDVTLTDDTPDKSDLLVMVAKSTL